MVAHARKELGCMLRVVHLRYLTITADSDGFPPWILGSAFVVGNGWTSCISRISDFVAMEAQQVGPLFRWGNDSKYGNSIE